MSLPLHPHRAQNRFKPGELIPQEKTSTRMRFVDGLQQQ